ncbi:MAG: hypothetical protein J3K34DRAFT_409194 [Monoraphidium minutum]|nr:MAG: hypothetical protein J3K34DRAFT_409194 [Monoraphidium minutum]
MTRAQGTSVLHAGWANCAWGGGLLGTRWDGGQERIVPGRQDKTGGGRPGAGALAGPMVGQGKGRAGHGPAWRRATRQRGPQRRVQGRSAGAQRSARALAMGGGRAGFAPASAERRSEKGIRLLRGAASAAGRAARGRRWRAVMHAAWPLGPLASARLGPRGPRPHGGGGGGSGRPVWLGRPQGTRQCCWVRARARAGQCC